MDGLLNLLSSTGTLHGIEGPPEREPGESDEAYQERYDEWYSRTQTWKPEVRPA